MIDEAPLPPPIDFKAKTVVLSNILLEKVRDISFCVGKNSDLPILSNLKLSISDGQLTLIASDLVNTAKARIEVITEGQATVCVSFDLLSKHLATLESELISLVIDNFQQRLTVYTSQAEYKLPLESSDNWPKVAPSTHYYQFDVELGKLASKFHDVIPFVSQESARLNLNGINIRFGKSKLIISATDVNAFCIANINVENLPEPPEGNLSITLSSKIAKAFSAFVKNNSSELVTIQLNKTTLSFSELPNGVSIITQLIDGVFPDLEKLIPINNVNQLTVDRNKLLSALNRALPFVDDDLKHVRIKLANPEIVNLRAEDSSNMKHAWEKLSAEYQGNEIEFGMSITYLRNGLNIWKSEKLIIESSVPNKPIVLRNLEAAENDVVVIATALLRSNH